jgi:hypothetical protein
VSFHSPSVRRAVCAFLAIIILVQLSPVAVRASSPVRSQLATVSSQLRADLKLLDEHGKEAYLDSLFARLDADEARAKDIVARCVHGVGARPLGTSILALGSTILANVLSVVPESWQESIVINTLDKFIAKTLREVRGAISGMSAQALHKGLESILKLVNDPRFADGQALTGESWWERFFSNSTIVRNFLVVVVTLASIGVAVGLAIAGSTAAPIVAVIGALVALIALLNSHLMMI